MKKIIISMVFFIFIVKLAIADDLFFSDEKLVMDLSINSGITIIPKSPDYRISYLNADLLFYPKDYENQRVIFLNTEPSTTEFNNSLRFRFENPTQKKLSFSLNSRIEATNEIKKIKNKINFPLEETVFIEYTKPTENIDSGNEEIIKKASELAAGEDDLYVVVFKLADWTKSNINYSLDTLTADVTQSSSWVLKNKEGVCDEITSLFVAMSRSLGIPARYISGIAYTNYNNLNEWGPHAWAEVYFHDVGWVPYDLTYGQFGFIDASHIKLKESFDSDESSAKYEWLGSNVDIKTEKLNIDAALAGRAGNVPDQISLNAKPVKEAVGFGSYNIIETEIKNNEDYYISTELAISRIDGVDVIGHSRKNVFLKPNEIKKIYWVLKLSDSLIKDYIYTIPVAVYTTKNSSSEASFTSTHQDEILSFEDITNILNQKTEETEKVYSKNVALECISSKEEFYQYENSSINCNIKNIGNVFLQGIDVCYEKKCEKTDLGISQEKEISFPVNKQKTGKNYISITSKNNEISKAAYIAITVLDEPKIDIAELDYPKSIKYRQPYSVSFSLKKSSLSIPQDISVALKRKNFEKKWNINELSSDQEFILNMDSRELGLGKNDFFIDVKYYDKNKKEYTSRDSFSMLLQEVTFLQKIEIFFRSLFA